MNSTQNERYKDLHADAGTTARDESWCAFQGINRRRRAIRDFDGSMIADEDVEAVLSEAVLAPSSGNAQPYVIHWLRDPGMKTAAAEACRNQRAAQSASTLLVFVAGSRLALETASLFRAYVESTAELSAESKAYHRKELKVRERFLGIASSVVWLPIHSVLATACPSLALLPFGPCAMQNWAARSAVFAAQTLLLAASARGLDTCPMEGFDPRKLARILGLRRGEVIVMVVAMGRGRRDARVEPRWRRSLKTAVRVH